MQTQSAREIAPNRPWISLLDPALKCSVLGSPTPSARNTEPHYEHFPTGNMEASAKPARSLCKSTHMRRVSETWPRFIPIGPILCSFRRDSTGSIGLQRVLDSLEKRRPRCLPTEASKSRSRKALELTGESHRTTRPGETHARRSLPLLVVDFKRPSSNVQGMTRQHSETTL